MACLVAGFILLFPHTSYPCSLASRFLTIPHDGDVYVARNGKILFAFVPNTKLEFTPKLTTSGQEVAGTMTGETRENFYAEGLLTHYATFVTEESLKPNTLYTFELVLDDPKDWYFSEPPQIQFVTTDFLDDKPPQFEEIEIRKIISREGFGSAACDYWETHNEVTLAIALPNEASKGADLFYQIFLTPENEPPDFEKPFRVIAGGGLEKNEENFLELTFDFPETEAKNYQLHFVAEDIYGHSSEVWSGSFTSVAKDSTPVEQAIPLEPLASASAPTPLGGCSLVIPHQSLHKASLAVRQAGVSL